MSISHYICLFNLVVRIFVSIFIGHFCSEVGRKAPRLATLANFRMSIVYTLLIISTAVPSQKVFRNFIMSGAMEAQATM